MVYKSKILKNKRIWRPLNLQTTPAFWRTNSLNYSGLHRHDVFFITLRNEHIWHVSTSICFNPPGRHTHSGSCEEQSFRDPQKFMTSQGIWWYEKAQMLKCGEPLYIRKAPRGYYGSFLSQGFPVMKFYVDNG